nr:reverse transcriptase domain-containing protein [Tanacetum cinerariifolium]
MTKEDDEKTAFITSQRIFYYLKMSFELKNVGVTYQRLVDDLVIKSRTEQEVIRDIKETFKTLREINMKLNLKKCTFGMTEGMFLGYKLNADGLKVCPDKVEVVLRLPSLKCLKDVQRLYGKLASVNRFLSKSAKKPLPFFKMLKKCTKKSDFQWTKEVEMAFKQMKTLIAELHMLTAPKEKENWSSTWRLPKKPSVRPRTSVKGQILADFIVERPEDDPPDTPTEDKKELSDPWILFTDRSSSKEPGMTKYLEKVKNLASNFKEFSIKQVPRGENKKADALSNMASTSFAHLRKQVLVEELKEKSIDEREVLAVVEEKERTWMNPIYEYLTEEILLEEKKKARSICRKAGKDCA